MAKRGRKPKIRFEATESQTEEIISLYKSGKAHSAIASETQIAEAHVRQILKNLGVRRSSRKFCGLTEEQDEKLLTYLRNLESYQGSYRVLRGMMEEFAKENEIQCNFAQAWRRSFYQRHQELLPPVIRTLLNLRPDQDDTEVVTESDDPDPERAETPDESGADLPTVEQDVMDAEETIEMDADLYAAVQEALEMYTKAGISADRARVLLRNMAVPGFGSPSQSKKRPKTQKSHSTNAMSSKPTSGGSSANSLGKNQKSTKKSPLQLRVLEREFRQSPQMTAARAAVLGYKLALEVDQVISWFRNKRHKRSAASKK